MEFQVNFTPAAQRHLNRLPEAVVSAMYEFAHGPLAQNPMRVSKSLHGVYEGAFTARRGDYRVMFYLDKDLKRVEVFRIQHRRNAYFRN